jgi:hypothetical protein
MLIWSYKFCCGIPRFCKAIKRRVVVTPMYHKVSLHSRLGPRSQWRTEGGGLGGLTPPPRNSEVLQSRTGLQIEWKMFSVPIPTS